MKIDIPTRVARGVALLDERMPGWEGAIDLIKLDVGDPESCVLGQLYGQYSNGCLDLGLWDEDEGTQTEENYGFEARDLGLLIEVEYRALTREWNRVLRVLRQKNEAKELVSDGIGS